MAVSGNWKLGQEVLFDKVLRRANCTEYEDRRSRIYNLWESSDFRHYQHRPYGTVEPAKGILVRLTQRRDTEVISLYSNGAQGRGGAEVPPGRTGGRGSPR